jgi:diguanylate cyclase (GGDEF)-like protein
MTVHAVLIISSDVLEQASLTEALRFDRHLVVLANDPIEAAELMQALSPDVLVTTGGDSSQSLRGQLTEHGCDCAEMIPLVRIVDAGPAPAAPVCGETVLQRPVSPEALRAAMSRLLAWSELRSPRRTRTSGPPRVLLIEHEPLHREMVASSLHVIGHAGVTLECAGTVDEASRFIEGGRFDVIILTDELPGGSTLDLLAQFECLLMNTPVIGLVASRDPHLVIDMLRAGCVDVLHKHKVFRERELERQLRWALARFHRRRASAVLAAPIFETANGAPEPGANIDELTGLVSPAMLDSAQARMHEECFARNVPYAVCAVNVDHFRHYNQRYGRPAGDAILCTVAETLRDAIRDTDVAGRLTGARFRVLLPGADANVAARVGERMRTLIVKRAMPHEANGPLKQVTASVGVASAEPSAWEDCTSIVARAEETTAALRAQGGDLSELAPTSSTAPSRNGLVTL